MIVRRIAGAETGIERALDEFMSARTNPVDFDVLMRDAWEHLFQSEAGRVKVRRGAAGGYDGAGYVPASELIQAYGEHAADRPRSELVPVSAGRRRRLTLEGLSGLSENGLHALRRRLAFANHPDLAPGLQRDDAHRRMARINELIDAALESLRPGARMFTVSSHD